MISTTNIQDFIEAHTALMPVPFVPKMKLLQAEKMMRVWKDLEALAGQPNVPMPFWSFVWPGGQALARHIINYPEIVQGKRVLDLACGSGVSAIAAQKAGAAQVTASDIDPMAQMATTLNAAHNDVDIEVMGEVDMSAPPADIDLIIAGDICYEQVMSQRILRWLMMCKESGVRVIVGDPKRGYAPDRNPDVRVTELATYTVPTSREIEEEDMRDVILWEVERYSAA